MHISDFSFRVDDHKFTITGEKKTSSSAQEPLLINTLTSFGSALETIVKDLKNFYHPDHDRKCFLVFVHGDLTKSMNIAHFNLKDASITRSVNDFISHLDNLVQSYEDIGLDKSFQIIVHVWSENHATMSKTSENQPGQVENHGLEECDTDEELQGDSKKKQTFVGVEELPKDDRLNGICLLVATTLAAVLTRGYKSVDGKKSAPTINPEYEHDFSILHNYNSVNKKKRKRAIRKLCSLVKKVQKAKDTSFEGSTFDSSAEKLADYFKVNIYLHHSYNGDEIVRSTPFDMTRENIHLHQYIDSDGKSHIRFIRHYDLYGRNHGFFCFWCEKLYGSISNYKHKCESKHYPRCHKCRRFLATKTTVVNDSNKHEWCTSEFYKNQTKTCNCGRDFQSDDCLKFHESTLCKRSDAMALKQGQCQICKQFHNGSLCQLLKSKVKDNRPKICAISLGLTLPCVYQCEACYSLNENESEINFLCEHHTNQDNLDKPNLANHLFSLRETDEMLQEKSIYLPNGSKRVIGYDSTEKDLNEKGKEKKKVQASHKGSFGNPRRNRTIEHLKDYNTKCPVQMFVKDLVSSPSYTNTVVVGDNNALHYIFRAMVTMRLTSASRLRDSNQKKDVIYRQGKILQLSLPNGIIILPIESFIPESSIAEYKNQKDQRFFPLCMNYETNFDLVLDKWPAKSLYLLRDDSQELRKLKEMFVESHKEEVWDFREEMVLYLESSAEITFKWALKTLKVSGDFQDFMIKKLCQKDKKSSVVFNHTSLASFSYHCLQHLCLEEKDIRIVKCPETGVYDSNCSIPEHSYQLFMNYKHPNNELIGSYLTGSGGKVFGRFLPDVYDPVTKTVYCFHGCYHHKHNPAECLFKRNDLKEPKNFLDYKKKQTKDQEAFDQAERNFPNDIIGPQVNEWHCKYIYNTQKSQEYQNFVASCKHDLENFGRLVPRDAMYPCLIDLLQVQWTEKNSNDEVLEWLDINGCFAACAKRFSFPVGEYKVVMSNEVTKETKIGIDGALIMNDGSDAKGVIKVRLEPPEKVEDLYLSFRDKNRKLYYGLCFTCTTENSRNPCEHPKGDPKRFFVTTTTISELNYAIREKHYRIDFIFEAYLYEREERIFKDFVDAMEEFKQLHDADPFVKKFIKKMYVNMWGKLSQRPILDTQIICSNDYELKKTFAIHKNDVKFFEYIGQGQLLCTVPKRSAKKTTMKHNVILGAHIFAFARQMLSEVIKDVKSKVPSMRLFHLNTDSLMFSRKKTDSIKDLDIGKNIGQLKNQLPDALKITSFYAISPTVFNVAYIERESLQQKSLTKCSGMSLNNSLNKNKINEESFAMQVQRGIRSQEFNIPLDQIITIRGKEGQIKMTARKRSIRNRLFKKRVFSSVQSPGLPFGYRSISRQQKEVDDFIDQCNEMQQQLTPSGSKRRKLS